MSVFILIAILMGGIILMSLMGIRAAMICPKCKAKWALTWQEGHQRDRCKYCGYYVHVCDFVPPKVSYLKFLQNYSPITYKYKKGDNIDKEKL